MPSVPTAVTVTQSVVTFTFGGLLAARAFTFSGLPNGVTQIPAGPTPPMNFVLQVPCGTPTCDGSFFAPAAGTLSLTITGTDSNGHAVNFKSQSFTLLAAQ